MPVHNQFDTYGRRSESIYYTAKEFDSEDDSDCTRKSSSSSKRRYIDPWDLENYVYIRKQMQYTPKTTSKELMHIPVPQQNYSNKIYYLPTNSDFVDLDYQRCPVVEEEIFHYNNPTVIEDVNGVDEFIYNTSYTDMETSSGEDQQSSCESSMSALQLHTPGFGANSGRRPIVLPKPLPQLEFPGPPSYEPNYEAPSCYYNMPPENNYYTVNDCIECLHQQNENMPLYATNRRRPSSRRKNSIYGYGRVAPPLGPASSLPTIISPPPPQSASFCSTPQHFSLSKKGLLKIDYSCNWNSLDRYIANNVN